ncbi:MAG: protein kinase [Vicinamibacterales bacterium]
MAWSTGTQVGGYEIIHLLGVGGMGEVYRARNVRLQRDVALKVLPASLMQDSERRARFEREARLLASLSHPNIGGIFGIEDMHGPGGPAPVLVLEFIDGQNLADRISAARVPIDDAMAIALQVAEALEAAHDRGIIHRDLKPANVLLTRDGIAKVLDFGLAKALDADPSSSRSDPALSPTLTSASTQLGVIMGTAAYMAPEQARGKTVDRRADIWAFGALLFEMLSGARAFPGETISDTLAAILTTEPDWTKLPKETSPAVVALIRRCLERDPRERLQSIGEARIVLSNPSRMLQPLVAQQARGGMSSFAVAAIALAAVALTGVAVSWWLRDSPAAGHGVLRRLDLALDGAETRLDHIPVLSPDGSRIVYISGGSLWVRSLSEFASKEIPKSQGAAYPFWAPDGEHLAFVVAEKLWRASVKDGEPELVGAVPVDMTGSGAGAWTAAGNFLVVGSDKSGITEISGRDGSSRELLALDRKLESDFHEISELPGGRGLLFTAHTSQGADTIVLLAGGKRRDVLKLPGETLRAPVYDPAGYLLFGRETSRRGIWAVPFSLQSLSTEGAPFLVDVSGNYPSIGSDGTLAMVRRSERPSELVWVDRSGSITPAGLLTGQAMEAGPWSIMRLSPDGNRVAIALASATAGSELWVYDLKRGVTSPLSRGAQMAVWPTWMPDSARILFGGFVGGRAWNVHSVAATETTTPQRLLAQNAEAQWPCSISPDGTWLLYAQIVAPNTDLWIASLSNPSDAKPLMTTPAREQEGHFSPDGRWIAYISDESGRFELYVRRFPIGSDRVQISNGGVGTVGWASGGRELVYRAGADVMSVALTEKDGRLEPAAAQRLFSIADQAISRSFAVAADGQRFLFARATGGDRISVILNWRSGILNNP